MGARANASVRYYVAGAHRDFARAYALLCPERRAEFTVESFGQEWTQDEGSLGRLEHVVKTRGSGEGFFYLDFANDGKYFRIAARKEDGAWRVCPPHDAVLGIRQPD